MLKGINIADIKIYLVVSNCNSIQWEINELILHPGFLCNNHQLVGSVSALMAWQEMDASRD